jgi:hypothetical protein
MKFTVQWIDEIIFSLVPSKKSIIIIKATGGITFIFQTSNEKTKQKQNKTQTKQEKREKIKKNPPVLS